MLNKNFSGNLRLLCKQQPSISHVCRAIEINRQQFNKYLNGSVYPSRHNLNKICRYFHVEPSCFKLTAKAFSKSLKLGHDGHSPEKWLKTDLNEIVDSLPNSVDKLKHYTGYYYSHFLSMGYPGYIVRSLVHLYQFQHRYYTKSIEQLWDKKLPKSNRNRFKYQGIVLYLADRLFLTEYETLNRQVVYHTVLFPNYRTTLDYISGITVGVGSLSTHIPKATRVEYQYLGESINLKQALSECGLFKTQSKAINDEIKSKIYNTIVSGEEMLTAHSL